MEFFETVKNTISRTTRVVAKKSNDLVELTKLRAAQVDTEAEMKRIFRQMGQDLYEAYKTGAESYGSLEESCEQVDALYARLEELTTQISALKNAKLCPLCKKEMDKDATFCSACGHRFDAE